MKLLSKEKYYSVMDESGFCYGHSKNHRKAFKFYRETLDSLRKSPVTTHAKDAKGKVILVRQERIVKITILNSAPYGGRNHK